MGGQYRERKNGTGCKHFDSGHCTHDDNPFYRCGDWIASHNENDWNISYSQQRSFERCPYKWYLEQIVGISIKEPYLSIQLRMGKEFANIISGKYNPPSTYLSTDELINLRTVILMVHIIKEYDMLAPDRDRLSAIKTGSMAYSISLTKEENCSVK